MTSNSAVWPVLQAWSVAAALLAAQPALAHGKQDHGKAQAAAVKQEQKDWGVAGDARSVKRTINVSMSDAMRFTPDSVQVVLGETVKFVVHNGGRALHEFVIGTRAENDKHADLMVRFPNMEHDEPYMAHVAPGKTGEVIWTFNREGEFEFACLIAGHYQAGMVGRIKVVPAVR